MFIELTRMSNKPEFVNVNDIVVISDSNQGGSTIKFRNFRDFVLYQEPYEDVVVMIREGLK